MNDLTVISSTQQIFVDPFSSTTANALDGEIGPDGMTGPQGFIGTGEGYATDSELATTVASLDSRLDILEGNMSSWSTLTLLSPWAVYGGEWAVPRYRKIDGIVYLEGLIRSTVVPPSSALIATFPVGFRPPGNTLFVAHSADPYTVARIDVNTSGSVVYVNGSVGYISLSGISFSVT